MEDGADLPIALRRTRRSVGQATKQSPCASPAQQAPDLPVARTPKSRKRRVRFSDPGPDLTNTRDEPTSTGLTPMIRRTSLGGNRTARRHSTPASLSHSMTSSGIPHLDAQGSPYGGEVYFLPLRQVLDGRVKRRIRRNGLSEEMNNISAERRRRSEETKAEIERLKAELAEKDEEIERLHDETVVLDTDRVWDLEQQVETLKRQLASRSGVQQTPSSPAYEWTRAARDPFSDDFMDLDNDDDDGDEEFGEATRAELVCSTPSRRMRASFPTPPATSPEPQLPQTPCRRLATPHLGASVQAALPDPEKRQLQQELDSLQREVKKLTATLESYTTLTSRLSDTLTPFSATTTSKETSAEPGDLEVHLATVLQNLSDKTAALAELDKSLKSLGFPGSDALEVIDSLRTGFRSARLELEYLTPGEVTLPLTGAGAEVLDLVLTQLRTLAQKSHDADESIDEYHEIELSLRQQLNARVTAMDSLHTQLSKTTRESHAKDARITDLEVGLDRLKNAARAYTRDIAELEALVERMDGELSTSNTDRHNAIAAQQAATLALTQKSSTITALEEKLTTALSQTTDLQSQLADLTTTHAATLAAHKDELATLTRAHGTALAQRDVRVAELRAEVERLDAALREAHEAVQKLRTENGRLRAEGAGARRRAREVVDGMRAELERVVRMGEGFLGALGGEGRPAEEEQEEVTSGCQTVTAGRDTAAAGGEGKVGRLLEARDDVVRSVGRGTKRRRYDSGLGLLDEEEVADGV